MIDYCTSKRIFSFVIALIVFSILLFFVEEIAEENETVDMSFKQLQQPQKDAKEEHVTNSSNDCWLRESFTVVQTCLPCSEFEMKAIKAKHCLPSGFFDRLNCSSGAQALRPCTDKKPTNQGSFYWFAGLNILALAISYVAATKRKEHLDTYAYMRVAQQFE